jgi:hypothetical protein
MKKVDNGHSFHLSVSVVSTISRNIFDHDQFPIHITPFTLLCAYLSTKPTT